MRPRGGRKNHLLETGVMMLLIELFSTGFGAIPPVTLAAIAGQVLLYIGFFNVPWEKWDVCISGEKVIYRHDFKPIALSPLEHANDMHLYYNMISFLVKGRTLEYKYGSANFAFLLVIISLLTSLIHVALAFIGSEILDKSIMTTCSIGFSGVIFALKFITTQVEPASFRYVQGFRVPARFATWVELLAIHVLVPNASFVGHMSGILAGLLYMKTFIGTIIDSLLGLITGVEMCHYSQSRRRSDYQRRNSQWFNANNYNYSNNLYQGFFGQAFGHNRRSY